MRRERCDGAAALRRLVSCGVLIVGAACGGGGATTPGPPMAPSVSLAVGLVPAASFQGTPAATSVVVTASNCTPTVSWTYGTQAGTGAAATVRRDRAVLAVRYAATCGSATATPVLVAVTTFPLPLTRDTVLLGAEGDTLRVPLTRLVVGQYESASATGDDRSDAVIVNDTLRVVPKASSPSGVGAVQLRVHAGSDRLNATVAYDRAPLVTVSGQVRDIREHAYTDATSGVLRARGKAYAFTTDASGRFVVRVPAGVVEFGDVTSAGKYDIGTSWQWPAAIARDSIRPVFKTPAGYVVRAGLDLSRDTVNVSRDVNVTLRVVDKDDPDMSLDQWRIIMEGSNIPATTSRYYGWPMYTGTTWRIKAANRDFKADRGPGRVPLSCGAITHRLDSLRQAEMPFIQASVAGQYRVEHVPTSSDTTWSPGDIFLCALTGTDTLDFGGLASPKLDSSSGIQGGYAAVTPRVQFSVASVRKVMYSELGSSLYGTRGDDYPDCINIRTLPFTQNTCVAVGQQGIFDDKGRLLNATRPAEFNETVRLMGIHFGLPAAKRADVLGRGACRILDFGNVKCFYTTFGTAP